MLDHIVATCTDRLTGSSPIFEDVQARRRSPTDGPSPVGAEPEPLSLSYGYPGVALLFAELGWHDGHLTKLADSCLARAASQSRPPDWNGLYSGYAAMAFACRAMKDGPANLADVLRRLDQAIAELAHNAIRACRQARESPENALRMHHYDLISGLVGLGRYFLLDGVGRADVVSGIVGALVEMTKPITLDGTRLPGWWVGQHPSLAVDDFPEGHGNLGMSHGVAGCLALLAIARMNGHQVAGQDDAIARMASFLTSWRQVDDIGRPYWPEHLSREQYLGHVPITYTSPPIGWCYGVSGFARAVQLAGLALGEREWLDVARTAAKGIVARVDDQYTLGGAQLCHGWAGVLQSLLRLDATLGDPDIDAGVDRVLEKILKAYDPELPFGFRTRSEYPNGKDDPGFLNGAAGIGLPLHCYITRKMPASGWDAALLLW